MLDPLGRPRVLDAARQPLGDRRALAANINGSYASRDNLRRAKACGVRDMAFHMKGGLAIDEMVTSRPPPGSAMSLKTAPWAACWFGEMVGTERAAALFKLSVSS